MYSVCTSDIHLLATGCEHTLYVHMFLEKKSYVNVYLQPPCIAVCEKPCLHFILTSMLPHSRARANRVLSSFTKWRATCMVRVNVRAMYHCDCSTAVLLYASYFRVSLLLEVGNDRLTNKVGIAHHVENLNQKRWEIYIHVNPPSISLSLSLSFSLSHFPPLLIPLPFPRSCLLPLISTSLSPSLSTL